MASNRWHRASTDVWEVRAFEVEHARSAFFDDTSVFPRGSVRFGPRLIMRDVPHSWHALNPGTKADDTTVG
jgi:hypothetical protein